MRCYSGKFGAAQPMLHIFRGGKGESWRLRCVQRAGFKNLSPNKWGEGIFLFMILQLDKTALRFIERS